MQLDCCDYAILGARTSGLDRGQTGKISVVSTFACDWTVVRQVRSVSSLPSCVIGPWSDR